MEGHARASRSGTGARFQGGDLGCLGQVLATIVFLGKRGRQGQQEPRWCAGMGWGWASGTQPWKASPEPSAILWPRQGKTEGVAVENCRDAA
jgi:hypothetical protein